MASSFSSFVTPVSRMVSKAATFIAFTSKVCSVRSTADEVEFNATSAISCSVLILLKYINTPDTTISAITKIKNSLITCETRCFCSVWPVALDVCFLSFFIFLLLFFAASRLPNQSESQQIL